MTQGVWFDRSTAGGRLELTDQHRLDLVHRMSTNDLNSLKIGEGCATVFTTALARIIDRVIVYHRGETALMLSAQPQVVQNWLRRHIFWQDRVKIKDVSGDWAQIETYGPVSLEFATQISPEAATLPLHHWREQDGIITARTYPLGGEGTHGFIFLVPVPMLDTFKTRLSECTGLLPGDDHAYEVMRIGAGLPAAGHELSESYIPLEAGLWDSVSFRKGCYIGQEIIARMESRNRLAKTLIALQLDGDAPLGAKLLAPDGSEGILTSIAQREDGVRVGLGFIKPQTAETGTLLQVEGSASTAVITTAPLITERRISV